MCLPEVFDTMARAEVFDTLARALPAVAGRRCLTPWRRHLGSRCRVRAEAEMPRQLFQATPRDAEVFDTSVEE
jgi:hypothetical protein